MPIRGDFYEDDEPIAEIRAAWERGRKLPTGRPPLAESPPDDVRAIVTFARACGLAVPGRLDELLRQRERSERGSTVAITEAAGICDTCEATVSLMNRGRLGSGGAGRTAIHKVALHRQPAELGGGRCAGSCMPAREIVQRPVRLRTGRRVA